jgi:hypothetical protein
MNKKGSNPLPPSNVVKPPPPPSPPMLHTEFGINAIGKYTYSMSEPHLDGYRLILGFKTLEEVQAAQLSLAAIARTNEQTPCNAQGTSKHGRHCTCGYCQ